MILVLRKLFIISCLVFITIFFGCKNYYQYHELNINFKEKVYRYKHFGIQIDSLLGYNLIKDPTSVTVKLPKSKLRKYNSEEKVVFALAMKIFNSNNPNFNSIEDISDSDSDTFAITISTPIHEIFWDSSGSSESLKFVSLTNEYKDSVLSYFDIFKQNGYYKRVLMNNDTDTVIIMNSNGVVTDSDSAKIITWDTSKIEFRIQVNISKKPPTIINKICNLFLPNGELKRKEIPNDVFSYFNHKDREILFQIKNSITDTTYLIQYKKFPMLKENR